MIEKIIPLWIKQRSHQTIWLLTASLIVMCWLQPQIFDEFFRTNIQLTTPILGKASISLFLISLALLTSLFILHRRPNIKDYKSINPPGLLKHLRTNKYYCQRCFVKDHIASELYIFSENKLVCRCCNELYDISTKIIPASYFGKAWNEFVKEFISKP